MSQKSKSARKTELMNDDRRRQQQDKHKATKPTDDPKFYGNKGNSIPKVEMDEDEYLENETKDGDVRQRDAGSKRTQKGNYTG